MDAQVRMGAERVVPLARLRGQVRPVLLAGSMGYVNRALKAAEPHRPELRLRGIALVPLVLSDENPEARLQLLKAQFRCGRPRVKWGSQSWCSCPDLLCEPVRTCCSQGYLAVLTH